MLDNSTDSSRCAIHKDRFGAYVHLKARRTGEITEDMKAVISAAVAMCLLGASAHAQSQAVQWRVEDGGNGHWYARLDGAMDFLSARAAAQSLGAHLATCRSAEEWVRIAAVAAAPPLQEPYFWIGLYQDQASPEYSEPAGAWRWIDGTTTSFSAWNGGEPNNTKQIEHFAHGFFSSGVALWNDCPGSNAYVSVIEWSADCNNDGIVDYGQILDKSLFDGDSNGVPDCCELGYDCTQNLIQNGSFESGPAQPDCTWVIVGPGSTVIAPWQVTHADVDRQHSSPACVQVLSWVSYHGEYTVDLDGWVPGGGISQTIATTPGRQYRLSMQLTGNCGPNVPKTILVSAGGNAAEFSTTCQYVYPEPWLPVAMTFTPTGASTTIAIRSLSSSGNNGPVIDDVRVSPFGEPLSCLGDITGNGQVNGVDLSAVLTAWGTNGQSELGADINGDGNVDGLDLTVVLAGWGPCP